MGIINKANENILKKQWLIPILIGVVVLLPKLYFCLKAIPLRSTSDEFGTLGVAASLAGYEWGDILPRAPYYGYGYTTLFFWIFKIFKNPVVIYRVYLIVGAIFQSSGAFFTYKILTKYHREMAPLSKIVLCICAGYLVVTRATIVYNEQPMIFISWALCYAIYNLICNRNSKNPYSILVAILLSWAITIHIRSIIFIISFILVMFIYYLRKRKSIVTLSSIFAAILLLSIAILLNKYVQSTFWEASNGLKNTSLLVGSKESLIDILKNVPSWTAIANVIVGQIFTISLFSGGVFYYSMALSITWLIKSCFHSHDQSIPDSFYPMLFFIFCIFGTIMGQVFNWLPQAYEAVSAGHNSGGYGIKAFTYVRYFGPYVGPTILLTICQLSKISIVDDSILKKQIAMNTTILFAFIFLFFVFSVYPYIALTKWKDALEVFYPFSLMSLSDPIRIRLTLPGVIVSIITYAALTLVFIKKRIPMYLAALAMFLIYQYGYNAENYDIYLQNEQQKNVDSTMDYLKNRAELPKELYVFDSKPGNENYFLYQFLLGSTEVRAVQDDFVGFPDTDKWIMLSDIALENDKLDEDVKNIRIDDNEYIYYKE